MSKKLAPVLIALLALAPVGCVSSKKGKEEQKVSTAGFVLDAPPKDMKKVNINFDDKVSLIGYKLEKAGKVKPGDTVKYSLYWKVEKPLEANGWKLFTHVLNSKKTRILNIDEVGSLRDEKAIGPSKWQVGKIYEDAQYFKVPANAKGETLSVVTGFWKGDQRLKLKSGPNAGADRALAFKVRVVGSKPQSTKLPELRIDRLEAATTIKIDGKLDEPAWAKAAATGPFVNVRTGKADAASKVQGDAKLLWDAKGLYVGFNVVDKDITGGFKKTDKDPHLWTKDCVELMIDPDGDGDNKDYYEIQVNPQNLVFDSRFDDYNLPKPEPGKDGPYGHQDWSSKLVSAVTIDGTLDKSDDEDKGYVVELHIPWTSFDKAKQVPPELGQSWRINLYAMQDNSGVGWSPILGEGNFHKASRFGRVLWAEEGWQPPPSEKTATGVSAEAVKAGASAKAEGETAPVKGVSAVPVLPKSPVDLKVVPPKVPAPAAPKPAAPAAPKPAAPAPAP